MPFRQIIEEIQSYVNNSVAIEMTLSWFVGLKNRGYQL